MKDKSRKINYKGNTPIVKVQNKAGVYEPLPDSETIERKLERISYRMKTGQQEARQLKESCMNSTLQGALRIIESEQDLDKFTILNLVMTESRIRNEIASIERQRRSKGGKKSKTKTWAQAMASELLKNNPGMTFKELWQLIPEGEGEPGKYYAGFEVYRDGNRLLADSGSKPDKNISKGTFQNYISKVRKSKNK